MSFWNDKTAERIVVTVDEDLEELIPGFLENRRRDILEIRSALGLKDFKKIGVIGHGMKGAGGGYGFDAITETGRQLEDAAIEGSGDKIRIIAEELGFYLDMVVVHYE